MKLTGKTYDTLKAVAQIYLPALGAMYFSLAGIWGLPSADDVVGTIVIVDTFLGVVLGISSSNFSSTNVGTLVAQRTASGGKAFTLEIDGDPDELDENDEVRFKVAKRKNPNEPMGVRGAVEDEAGLTLVELLVALLVVGFIVALFMLGGVR